MSSQNYSSKYKKKGKSKYDKVSYTNEIFPHKHCPVCNTMMDEDQDYCSAECGVISKKKDKGGKKKIFFFIGIYIVVIALLFVFLL